VQRLIAGLPLLTPLLSAAAGDYRKQPDGILLQTAAGSRRVQVVTDSIVRVTFAKSDILFTRQASAVLPVASQVKWSLAGAGGKTFGRERPRLEAFVPK
jgi:hypothetical protein